ncbi:hypothetical protein BH23ACT8_BH23ACT8_20010 [soil metagenome]|jgi:hypothetical protein
MLWPTIWWILQAAHTVVALAMIGFVVFIVVAGARDVVNGKTLPSSEDDFYSGFGASGGSD